MRPVFPLGEPFMREGIFLELPGRKVKDFKSGDADGAGGVTGIGRLHGDGSILTRWHHDRAGRCEGRDPEDREDKAQSIVIPHQRVVVQKNQDRGPALANRIVSSPGNPQVFGGDEIPKRNGGVGSDKIFYGLIGN